ncbi:MAG TPA: hypothetical protein VKG86_07885 [Terracidiphilus sp.]|nr:hypothetical protein [Terracidiphilus sp.]
MKTWQKSLIITLITLTIGGIYLFSVWKQRQNPGAIGRNDASQTLSKDDLVVMRAFFPAHFEDLQRLEGATVWMKNGYTMPYYPYAGGHVEFGRRVGLIPVAQRLEVKKIVKAAVPPKEDDGVGHGSRQAFAVFALPGGTGLFATPIGSMEGDREAYYADLLFFYDDPHGIYDYWPKDVWAAIDAHQVKQGMSELQTRMAIGQKMHADGNKEGDRTVTYDQDGKHWTITYVKDRATTILTTARSE